jgi:hypothetical protein
MFMADSGRLRCLPVLVSLMPGVAPVLAALLTLSARTLMKKLAMPQ